MEWEIIENKSPNLTMHKTMVKIGDINVIRYFINKGSSERFIARMQNDKEYADSVIFNSFMYDAFIQELKSVYSTKDGNKRNVL